MLAYEYLKETSTLNSGDTLSGSDVLSGFEHPVAEIFEQNPGETVENEGEHRPGRSSRLRPVIEESSLRS